MTSTFVALCIDANDPLRLAQFWAHALRWDVGDEVEGAVRLVPSDGARFGLLFAPVATPKLGQNRIHLDLTTASIDDQTQSVEQLIALGARHVDIGQGPDETHVVLADPEGNEFCIIEPGNNFLAGCGRLGAINCDGTKELGYFWSAVLDWPLVWDQDEETAIRAPDGTGSKITWSGPPLMPRQGKDRFHLHIAPDGDDRDAEIERLVALGARRSEYRDADRIVMLDPDGNEFCVVRASQP